MTRRQRDQVYWDEVTLRQLRAKPWSECSRQERDWYNKSVATAAMMNDYESENEGEEPPAQEAAEEEAKEPPSPSQSSRDDQWKPMDAVTAWCQQRERAENTRSHHRI